MKKALLLILISAVLVLSLTSCDIISGIMSKIPRGGNACEHEWAEANCKTAKTCTKCGESNGEKTDHIYSEATCKSPAICQTCGQSFGEKSDHNYSEATCTSPSICQTCGVWYGLPLGHDYSPASCTSPKTCQTCGYESGAPVHNYINATCTDPKTCSKCGSTDGKPLGHKLKTVVTEPTCNTDGYVEKSCTVCDFIDIGEVLPMLGHGGLSFVYNGDATAVTDGTATLACPYCDFSITETLVGSSALIAEAFSGKKISILGDSISTYIDVTSGVAADTTNSTIRNNIVWYGYSPSQPAFGGTSVDSTWWQIVINSLGATRLVNNSNAGESVFQAVTDRCMQLHDDTGDNAGETPDIIFVYLGTNDNNRTMGSVSNLNMADIERHGDDPDYQPSTLIEAYAIMIYRIQKTYPNAEIFCLTNLERSDQRKELTHAVSQVIRDVVDLYDGVYRADIGAFSGITLDHPHYQTYMPKDAGNKSLHPGAEGMKEIARVTLTSILENSKYMTGDIYDLMPEYGG